MPALDPARAEPTTATRTTQASTIALAELGLQRSPYSALHTVSCDCRDGVLVLRGCLPSYYHKQVAQEIVARLEGVKAIDNQILVITPAALSGQG